MNMSKVRNSEGKYAKPYSKKFILSLWVGSILSIFLLYLAGTALTDTMSAFQSCSSNSTGLSISNCGKQGLNVGDIIIFVLFALSATLTVSLVTASLRATKRRG